MSLQILVLIVLQYTSLTRFVVPCEWFFITFMITIFVIAHFSFKFIESPWRRTLQNFFLENKVQRNVIANNL
jgi:peptidoglycan/LPS O-acetylase OafA/YrhL